MRPATEPPVATPPGDAQAPEIVPASPVQIPPATPASASGSSWIDPQALRPKPGDSWVEVDSPSATAMPSPPPKPGSSWVQLDTPQVTQPPAAQAPSPPPMPSAPARVSGSSWIDPSPQAPQTSESWVRFSQPAPTVQGSLPSPPPQTFSPPAQPYAQPGYPPTAYPPAYGKAPYAQGFPPQGYAMPVPAQFLQGVGGWLMFFIVCLTIIGPLVALFMVIIFLMAAGANVNSDAILARLFAVFAVMIVPYTIWGMFVGVSLWKIRPGSVRQTKQYLLWGSIPFTFLYGVMPYMILPAWHRGPTLGSFAFGFISTGVVLALAWNSYLTKSRRVAITYPQG
ncbi:MAG TPA: hypothetical protein VKR82_07785 [Candidatus Acidoferrales bacterium]|nr:hypothetical protein [Candidatus Acidoferrales bacterium]